jgi:hypothetical protein
LCEGDSDDDNREWPNTASIPSLSLSRKRPRDIEKQPSNDAYSCYENGPRNKNATGSAEFVVELELADEVEVSPYRKRRSDVKSYRSVEDDAAGKCAQILKEGNAIEKDVGSEDAHVADHRESREGIDLTQTGQDDRSAEKCYRKVSPSEHHQKRRAGHIGSPSGKNV